MKPHPSLRVYVADEDGLARYGVVHTLKASGRFDVVGEADDGRQALEDLAGLAPDVAVLGEQLRTLSAIDVLSDLPRPIPTRVVVLSRRVDHAGIYAALAAGASGYVVASHPSSGELCGIVLAAAHDEPALCPAAQRALTSQIQNGHAHSQVALTLREREVLRLAADGLQAGEIAYRLSIGVSTVKKHQQNAYDKLGVATCAGAVAKALRLGVID